jgi:hypothetical protein
MKHSKTHPNCRGCSSRCQHSLRTPFNNECPLADEIAGTGRKEQLRIRNLTRVAVEAMEDINAKEVE